MRLARAAGVVIALVGAGCGLFPDLSPLTEGDAAPADASNDASNGDVAQTADAKPDAGADVFASPCASQHTFCDDFDGPFGALWDSSEVQSGPLVASTTSVSGFSLEATANSNGDTSALYKHFDAATHTHVEFDALVQAPSDTTNQGVDLIAFVLDSAPDPYTFAVLDMSRWDDVSEIEQYADNADASTDKTLDFSEQLVTWHHLALDVDFDAQTFVAFVDGVEVQNLAFDPNMSATGFTLYLGDAYSSVNDPWYVFIDDFVLDQN